MAHFNFRKSETGNYFDIVIEADFEDQLNAEEMSQVFQIVHQTFANTVFQKLFVGLINMETTVSIANLQLRFRYLYWAAEGMKIVPENHQEYIGMRRINSIYYVFAKVDEKYKIVDAEFLPYFRSWLDLPDMIKEDKILAYIQNE
jgi:hypothetical protein